MPPAGTGAWFPAQRLVVDRPLRQLQILNVHLRPALMDPTAGPTTWHYQVSDGSDLLKLDIDHVMVDGRVSARDGRVFDAGTSDHRPVVVTIEAKPTP